MNANIIISTLSYVISTNSIEYKSDLYEFNNNLKSQLCHKLLVTVQ